MRQGIDGLTDEERNRREIDRVVAEERERLKNDWTAADGCSNNSRAFNELIAFIADNLRGQAFTIVNGEMEQVARGLLAQLAHVADVGPRTTLVKRVAALEAFARSITSITKHGPNGSGGKGPCDRDCIKCRAEAVLR